MRYNASLHSTQQIVPSIATLAGDNGRNCIATAIRPVFAPDCTCLWLGLYQLDNCSLKARSDFLDRVRVAIRDEF